MASETSRNRNALHTLIQQDALAIEANTLAPNGAESTATLYVPPFTEPTEKESESFKACIRVVVAGEPPLMARFQGEVLPALTKLRAHFGLPANGEVETVEGLGDAARFADYGCEVKLYIQFCRTTPLPKLVLRTFCIPVAAEETRAGDLAEAIFGKVVALAQKDGRAPIIQN